MEDKYQEYIYSILDEITSYYESKKSVNSEVFVLACQHILEPQAKMFELLSEFIPKENIHIFGKIYSTSSSVLDELKNKGFNIKQPVFNQSISFDDEHLSNCNNELDLFLSKIKTSSKIIILDDGGELLKVVNNRIDEVSKYGSIVGIEQTSSGFRKLENSVIHFPIFNVARSSVKLIKESPLIADLGCRRMFDVFKQYSIKEPRILVVGLGPMGSSTISIFKEQGYFSIGYDISHGSKSELIHLINENNINVIVGVTGANILDEKQLKEIKDTIDYKIYFISMSSADREFPTVYIRKNSESASGIHSDVAWDNLVLINNGFPITFKGNRYESTPEEIERTIGLLYGSTLEAITNDQIKETGFIDVPIVVTDIINKHE